MQFNSTTTPPPPLPSTPQEVSGPASWAIF